MPRGWKGYRRSGIALAMSHRLGGLSTYMRNSHGKGKEHLTYTLEVHGTLYFYFFSCMYLFVS